MKFLSLSLRSWVSMLPLILILLGSSYAQAATSPIHSLAPLSEVKGTLNKFIPTNITADLSVLSSKDQQAVAKLIQAAKLIDTLYYKQWSANGLTILNELTKYPNLYDQAYLKFFKLNYSQWYLEVPFINLDEPQPLGIELYPTDLTVDEWNTFLATLTPAQQDTFLYDFTVIRRDTSKKAKTSLVAIPYSTFYRSDLSQIAGLLKSAAALTTDKKLAKYLNSRADAFSSNNYVPSDADWLALDGQLDITIGPYEQYLDNIAGVKAMFMAMYTLVDPVETAKLNFVQSPAIKTFLVNHMPYPSVCGTNGTSQCSSADYILGGLASPIKVVNEFFSAGDYRYTAALAFNLPNNAVSRANGSKNVLLKNLNDVKFNSILVPIGQQILSPADQAKLDQSAFFTHTLTHELGHGITPHTLTNQADVGVELSTWYLSIEEGLADALGLWNGKLLHDLGGAGNPYTTLNLENYYTTFYTSIFRSIRFGIATESHARGSVIALAKGLKFCDACNPGRCAVKINNNGILSIDNNPMLDQTNCTTPTGHSLIEGAIEDLTRTYLGVEMSANSATTADFEAARNLFACSKDQLLGTDNTRTGRLGEPCCPAGGTVACAKGSAEQIHYSPNANFLRAQQNIEDANIPININKQYPKFDN